MDKGDIVLVKFPFTDFSGTKNRPALVLFSNDLDVTVAFISTQLKWKESTDVVLLPNLENGLKKEALVRLSKLATINRNLVLGILGKVDKQNHILLNQNLKSIFRLN